MAARKNTDTAWSFVILAVAGYLAYRFLFSGSKPKTNSFGGSPVGGADIGSGLQLPFFGKQPQQQQQAQRPQSPSLSAGQNSPSQQSTPRTGNPVANFINSILNFGWNAAQGIPVTTDSFLGQVDQQGIPLEPFQNLDNLPSYDFNDPNAPWNSSDLFNSPANSYDYGLIDPISTSLFDFGNYGQDASYFSSDYGYGSGSSDPSGGADYLYNQLYEPDYSGQLNGE